LKFSRINAIMFFKIATGQQGRILTGCCPNKKG
jgi:hypothetical protein